MTTHDDDHAGHDHSGDHAVDAHDDHFDAEPAATLSPGENPSPAWLPILGAGLFLIGGTYFLATPSSADPTAASASASASVSAPPAVSAVRPPTPAPGAPNLNDPHVIEKLRDQINQGGRPGGSAQPGAPPQPPASGKPQVGAPTPPPGAPTGAPKAPPKAPTKPVQ